MFLPGYGCTRTKAVCLLVGLGLVSLPGEYGFAQRVILSEDFESYVPDAFPGTPTADFFARSSIKFFTADFNRDADVDGNDLMTWQRGFLTGTTRAEGDANGNGTVDGTDLGIWESQLGSREPATAVVTGGRFSDPFNPAANKSLVLHNVDGTAQMAVTWADEFGDDANAFRNGSIEFDLWMQSPDPDAFWTFLGVRIGHGDATRTGVTGSPSDTTVWNTFRLQNNPNEELTDVLEQITDPGHRITFGIEPTNTDDNSSPSAGAWGPDQSVHVRFEFFENGYSFASLPTYRLFMNGNQIEWTGTVAGSPMEHPWTLGPGAALAPGVNMISFFTDASAHGANQNPGTGNVFIDNLVITNNDLPPPVVIVPEPGTGVLLLTSCALLGGSRRRARRVRLRGAP